MSLIPVMSPFRTTLLEKLYMDSRTADVYFVFDFGPQPERIPAHKNLLAAGSCVFDAMFYGDMRENGDVKIVEVSSAAFEVFLQFFYRAEVDVTVENVAELMYLGQKYQVAECSNKCERFLMNTIDEAHVCWAYELAIVYDKMRLMKFCEAVIGLKTKEVFASDSFRNCNSTVVMHIFKLDGLSCTEIELFEACVNRMKCIGTEQEKAEQSVKADIKNMFESFRAGTLSLKELAALSSSHHELISYDEHREMLQMAASAEFQSTIFNGNRRKRNSSEPWNDMEETLCLRIANGPRLRPDPAYLVKDFADTKFSTNQSVLLKEIKFADINDGDGIGNYFCYDAELTISEIPDSGEEIVLYKSDRIFLDGTFKPILIKSGIMYKIRLLSAKLSETFTSTLLKPQVEVESDFTVQFCTDAPDDAYMVGLVEGLVFIRF